MLWKACNDDLAKGVNFIALMKKNLENLRIGLQCR